MNKKIIIIYLIILFLLVGLGLYFYFNKDWFKEESPPVPSVSPAATSSGPIILSPAQLEELGKDTTAASSSVLSNETKRKIIKATTAPKTSTSSLNETMRIKLIESMSVKR